MKEWLEKYPQFPFVAVCSLAVAVCLALLPLTVPTISTPTPEPVITAPDSGSDSSGTANDRPTQGGSTGEVVVLSDYSHAIKVNSEQSREYIERVANALNGVRIEAGGTLSFAEVALTVLAPEEYILATTHIENDLDGLSECSMCQVATGLYIGSLRANLNASERHIHLTPVEYAPIGFDAKVSSDGADLKITNTSERPVTISSELLGDMLSIKISGRALAEGESVELIANALTSDVREDGTTVGGTEAIPGYDTYIIETFRLHYLEGALVETESLALNYYYAPILNETG